MPRVTKTQHVAYSLKSNPLGTICCFWIFLPEYFTRWRITINIYLKFPDQTPAYVDITVSLPASPRTGCAVICTCEWLSSTLSISALSKWNNKNRSNKYTDEGHEWIHYFPPSSCHLLTKDEHSHLYKIVFKTAVKDRQVQAVLAEEFILCAWTVANKEAMMLLKLSINVTVQQG